MRLVGRGWYQSLSGAYEEPPAMPVGYFLSQSSDRLIRSKEQKPILELLAIDGSEHCFASEGGFR